jgi:hypothetical protein
MIGAVRLASVWSVKRSQRTRTTKLRVTPSGDPAACSA